MYYNKLYRRQKQTASIYHEDNHGVEQKPTIRFEFVR